MTERLYYQHKLYECVATVVSCEKHEDGYAVILDKTVMFPESGGQLCDTGKISDANVISAIEIGEDVIHICDKELSVGSTVNVSIDVASRLDHTRQHTGEHILSGLISSMFGIANVGFHMAKDYCTIDTEAALSKEQIQLLELAANEAVMRNVKITTEITDASELEKYTLRKKTKGLEGEVRIVYIGDVDSCTCCGTHCEYSGEVGFITISDSMKYKQGTRLWFLCGERAVKYAQKNAKTVSDIANRFSTNKEESFNAVVKQGEELNALKRELKKRTEELFSYKAAELISNAEDAGGTKLVLSAVSCVGMQELKMLCEKIIIDEKNAVILFSKNADNVFYQVKTSKNVKQNAKEICFVINALTGGKGGGRDDFAQGSCNGSINVDETIEQLGAYLKKSLA